MKYIIANWKMKMNTSSVNNWIEEFSSEFNPADIDKKIIVAPSFIHIPLLANVDSDIEIASQDISEFEKGAHTGDVGNFQVKDYCKYAIVGHSERKEPRELVYKKRDRCLEMDITPIVCFVERDQLEDSYAEGALVAWEDPENIAINGVFTPKDPQEIKLMYNMFREILPDADVIYGGSVNRDNVADLISIPNLGGVLLGTASLDPRHFLDIYETF